jgi:tRNA(Ile)-lysidine synthase
MVRKEIEHQHLLEPGTTIVVGVSGGCDSLCLLHVLRRLCSEKDWSLHVAHLNHCLRGADADEDMVFVALRAIDWELPCTVQAIDIRTIAQLRRLSIEETSRQVRYGFLANVARHVGARAIAVGHHADDQSETVLMHFLRGAGLAGLRGMSSAVDLDNLHMINNRHVPSSTSSKIRLVRPLLSVRRTEIEAYCQTHNLSPRFDRSNLDTSFLRNRLRHELLPLLETYNPNIKALLRRTAQVAAADHDLFTNILSDAWTQTVTEERQDAISFNLARWRALPLALQRATLRHAAFRLRPRLRDVGFVHVENALGVAATGSTGARVTLPQRLCLTVDYQTLRLADIAEDVSLPHWPLLWIDERIPVTIPGATVLPDESNPARTRAPQDDSQKSTGSSGWRLETCRWQGPRKNALTNPDRWTAYLDADQLGPKPALRRRRPGDCFQPLGMKGQGIRVSDLMINVKIPRRWRDHIPLLVHARPGSDGVEEIAWVVGWRIDERVRITASTRHVVRLRWRRDPALVARNQDVRPLETDRGTEG